MLQFNEEELEFIKADEMSAPAYKLTLDRFNPFSPEAISELITNKTPSPFLGGKVIENIQEACVHAEQLTTMWSNEDKAAANEKRLKNNQRQKEFQERKRAQQIPPEVAAAKTAWKAALANKKVAMQEWDKYITQCHRYYLDIKISVANASYTGELK